MSIYSFIEPVRLHRFLLWVSRLLLLACLVLMFALPFLQGFGAFNVVLTSVFAALLVKWFRFKLSVHETTVRECLIAASAGRSAKHTYWQRFVDDYAKRFNVKKPIVFSFLNDTYGGDSAFAAESDGKYYVMVSKSLLYRTDNEIASVVLHELGHINHGDVKVNKYLYALFQLLPEITFFMCLLSLSSYGLMLMPALFALYVFSRSLYLWMNRQMEYLADLFVVQHSFYGCSMVTFIEGLQQRSRTSSLAFSNMLQTHPSYKCRARALKCQIEHKKQKNSEKGPQ